MSQYAIIQQGTVTNVIVAEPENEPVLPLLVPDADEIVSVTEQNGPAHIGGDMLDGRFRAAQPYASWTWDSEAWMWAAPVPYPEGGNGYLWDENTLAWIEIPGIEPIEIPGIEPEPVAE